MKRKLFILTTLFLGFYAHGQEGLATGQWRQHLAFGDVYEIVSSGELIYVRSTNSVYQYDPNIGEYEFFSTVNGFSEINPIKLEYIPEEKLLCIAYQNGNIDLLYNDGRIVNIPQILRSSIVDIKRINDFEYHQGKIYISGTFGILLLDLFSYDITESYINIGENGNKLEVLSTVVFQDKLYAASPKGIQWVPLSRSNPADFTQWNTFILSNKCQFLDIVNNQLVYNLEERIISTDFNSETTIQKIPNTAQYIQVKKQLNGNLISIYKDSSGLNHLYYLDAQNQFQILDSIEDFLMNTGVFFEERRGESIIFGGQGSELKTKLGEQVLFQRPPGPLSNKSYTIAQINSSDILVTAGGTDDIYNPTFNNDGFYVFSQGRWTNYKAFDEISEGLRDYTVVAQNPFSKNIFLASHSFGVLEVSPSFNQTINFYDENNSSLLKVPNGFTIPSGLAFDNNGNLWVSNWGAARALSVKTPNNEWHNFKLARDNVVGVQIDEYDQKWMMFRRDVGAGLMVFKENSISSEVGESRVYTTGNGTGNLPSNVVNAFAIDKNNEIWIGTEIGLTVISRPSEALEGGTDADAQRIIIDDGNDVGYLLGTQVINDIKIDGANRKWVATNNGVWLIAADGSSVLLNFTRDNSPLFSNSVNSIGINHKTGEVFFGTNLGLISYQADATEANETHQKVEVYPNPVKPNYKGLITIRGLPNAANVKITDINGNVVYETISNGGTATWNGNSFQGNRAATGVYLIFTANETGEETKVSKLLLVN